MINNQETVNESELESTDDTELDLNLLESIRKFGLQVPLDISPINSPHGVYQVIHGKRRLRACLELGIIDILVKRMSSELTKEQREEYILMA